MTQTVESACSVGDLGSIPGLGRAPGKGNGNPLQYSCLETPTPIFPIFLCSSIFLFSFFCNTYRFLGGLAGKEPACNAGDPGLIWIGKIPWRREWLPTPVFLPGEFHGQRSLEGYSPRGHKGLDMTERLTLSLFSHCLLIYYETHLFI